MKDVFDTNHNGKIDAGDANWSQFKVVVNDQMVSLASLGIASIDLTPTGSGQTFGDGSAITGTTTYTKSDGTKGQVGDAILAVDSNGYLIRQTQTTNAGGSVTTDIVGTNADGSKAFENVVTLSANGLSKTIKYDDDGDGVFDRSQTVVSVVNSDGSTTQTTSDFNADGSLKDRTASTTSADTRTVTTQIDTNGDGIWDQSQIYASNANGSASTTTKNLAANGKVINQTLVTTSTDGLTKTTKTDNTGSGVFDQIKIDSTAVKTDGSRVETVSDTGSSGFLIDKQVVTTSADGRSKTVQMDHTGTGTFDLVTTSTIVVGTDKSVTTTVEEKNANGTLRNSNVTVMTADGLSKTVSTDANGDGAVDRVFSDVTVTATGGVKTKTVSTKSGNGALLSKTVTTTSSDQKTINTVIDARADRGPDAERADLRGVRAGLQDPGRRGLDRAARCGTARRRAPRGDGGDPGVFGRGRLAQESRCVASPALGGPVIAGELPAQVRKGRGRCAGDSQHPERRRWRMRGRSGSGVFRSGVPRACGSSPRRDGSEG